MGHPSEQLLLTQTLGLFFVFVFFFFFVKAHCKPLLVQLTSPSSKKLHALEMANVCQASKTLP
jgi:hypothetical protein